MKPLSKELRNKFERTIENAREVAEEAAKIALEQLGVGEASPYSYLSEDDRALRRRLRAHGRNLGDVRDPKTETQEIDRLVEEIAYEHWHRMLFARFLAENDLLMYYEDDDIENAVPVTLSECDELGEELGLKNGWEVAAKLATKMLPQVFRADSPVFRIGLSPEKQRQLENLVSNIENDVFKASDSLGWAYQFWQNKKKSSINMSGVKVGSKELPAVTQLFTEAYMVQYIVDNIIGSWWANKILTNVDLKTSSSEKKLRDELKRTNLYFDYLRFNRAEDGSWEIVSDVSKLPQEISELTILDPSCGSGHFLIAAFLKLVPIRMELENLSVRQACDAVITENIFGLEIDQRCVEIAAFSLALEAWRYPNSGGFRVLPEFQIAWCGQSINVNQEEWKRLSKKDGNIEIHLDSVYSLLKHAPILGSLINPHKSFNQNSFFYKDSMNALEKLSESQNKDNRELAVIAYGIGKAIKLLVRKYSVVMTNVPYRKSANLTPILQEYIIKNYPDGKAALETAFLLRSLEFCENQGIMSLVIMQNWLQLKSYEPIRLEILKNYDVKLISMLGEGAFDTINGEVVKVAIVSIANQVKSNNYFYGNDLTGIKNLEDKSRSLQNDNLNRISQKEQIDNPKAIISIETIEQTKLLERYAKPTTGLQTGDNDKYIISFWEIQSVKFPWSKFQRAPEITKLYDGYSQLLRWEDGKGSLRNEPGAAIRGISCIGKKGILVNRMGKLCATLYSGELFNQNGAVILPNNEENLESIWCYLSSKEYHENVRILDKKIGVTPNTLASVGFDIIRWNKEAKELFKNGLSKPYSDDPTQWIFHGQPRKSVEPLQVAVARLLGYRWPTELGDEMELSDEAKALVKESEGLLSFADTDGIVCIPSVRGEAPASERLLNILAAAYKAEDINTILPGLLSDADHAGKSLELWLRDKFFTQHYKLFGHRPFIWQIWDGLKDGFSALINYHKLDRKNLETLIYTYLGDWISKQKSAMVEGIEGAEEKLNAAISLKKKLELILEGESPYDIFVRWKPLNKQPLGWEPDLNDGVRINIRPFMSVGDVGKKGAGVLRDKPNIKWTKDRGKDTENSPWYHLFGGDRINDHHVTLEEKKKAREEMR